MNGTYTTAEAIEMGFDLASPAAQAAENAAADAYAAECAAEAAAALAAWDGAGDLPEGNWYGPNEWEGRPLNFTDLPF